MDLERRLKQHGSGKGAKYTRGNKAERIVYRKKMKNYKSAAAREYQIKQLSRTEKIRLIKSAHKAKM